ncbi:MAG: ribonuclease III [Bacteroidetes bacterium]|nr:ribonuclease III [Bacteroidota bacterium]
MHRSVSIENQQGFRMNNERLEFLGDAILGAVIAELLFKKFPYREEGFLTEMRSRIVSRESLKKLAIRMGIDQFMEENEGTSKSMYGDALEAVIGAIYIDKGYPKARTFVLNKLVGVYLDLEKVEQTDNNYKSRILNFIQKEKHHLEFETVKEDPVTKKFTIRLMFNHKEIARASDFSKKRAEQSAAEIACNKLGLIES